MAVSSAATVVAKYNTKTIYTTAIAPYHRALYKADESFTVKVVYSFKSQFRKDVL